MNDFLTKLYVRFQSLLTSEQGQDVVEYGLVVALVAFAAVSGMSNLSSAINTAFNTVSTKISTAL
ncbi:MAG TPA: Flp family type IVb pilin [Terracidiphilus sp.]|nr:Flp family type IVb pilin [Terracidiphilus sp.]